MLSSGDVKEDLSLGKSEDGMGWDTVGIELLKRFEDGEEIKVVVQEILGKEYILEHSVLERIWVKGSNLSQ